MTSQLRIHLTSAIVGASIALVAVWTLWGGQVDAQEGGAFLAERPIVEPGTYAGADACRKCHFAKHKTWSKSHHPGAYDVLPAKYRTDRSCLECHATGLGQPGGFVSHARTPGLEGVQCEMCHGPGKQHADFMQQNDARKKEPAIIAQGRKLLGRNGGIAGARSGCYRCHLADSHDKHPKFDR